MKKYIVRISIITCLGVIMLLSSFQIGESSVEMSKKNIKLVNQTSDLSKIKILVRNQNEMATHPNNQEWTAEALFQAFQDDGVFTNQSPILSPGEKIRFHDEITGIDYDATSNVTTICFKSSWSDAHTICFAGEYPNLEVGDSITLVFQVILIDTQNEQNYIDLNYNVQVENSGHFPNLSDFLVDGK